MRAQVGDARVICGLSGGVDSSVAAALLHRAVGPQLTCIFVNNGLLRHGEVEQVQETFQRGLGLDLRCVDASERFLNGLSGVTDPETKRKTIGGEFIRVFEDAAAEIENVKWLAQGTLYPDVIESETPENRASARIKTHHNVRRPAGSAWISAWWSRCAYLFKDEVRAVGLELGLPDDIIYRQPFPGPGLAIRIIGEVTPERVELLRDCDRIVLDEIGVAGLYRDIWQSLRRPHRQPHGWRHGRLPHLRLRLRHPRRQLRGRHDRRLGTPALRRAGPHQQPHRQRSGRREPSGVRHHQQAPRHH